jgi:phospholipase C
MSQGLDNLKHIVVLMMENRSFDHMLGALKAQDSRINGLTGQESNPDTTNEPAKVQPSAEFQSQLDPDPDHHFPAVNKQLFYGTNGPAPGVVPAMNGFVQSYYEQRQDVDHSRKIMYYFKPEQLPVLTTLARSFAVFNGWFASIPGPTICNRAFAHYGTSFGSVTMNPFVVNKPILSIYDRMIQSNRTAKLYYFDQASSTMEVVNLLSHQSSVFGTYKQFLDDCAANRLPDYSFIEPNYSDHAGPGGGQLLASDQHPDHDVRAGEIFIASVYTRFSITPMSGRARLCSSFMTSTHVPSPNLRAEQVDGGTAPASDTGGAPFTFDRLGVRVPAILVSPWIPAATVIPGPEDPQGSIFEHASIPGTVTEHFLPGYAGQRTARETLANTFLRFLGDTMQPDDDCPSFRV